MSHYFPGGLRKWKPASRFRTGVWCVLLGKVVGVPNLTQKLVTFSGGSENGQSMVLIIICLIFGL